MDYKAHCKALEFRIRQLEHEIVRLKGGRPLTDAEVAFHNKQMEGKRRTDVLLERYKNEHTN